MRSRHLQWIYQTIPVILFLVCLALLTKSAVGFFTTRPHVELKKGYYFGSHVSKSFKIGKHRYQVIGLLKRKKSKSAYRVVLLQLHSGQAKTLSKGRRIFQSNARIRHISKYSLRLSTPLGYKIVYLNRKRTPIQKIRSFLASFHPETKLEDENYPEE